MSVSVFSLFKVGIGPSSSHTVGPMVACRRFLKILRETGHFPQVSGVVVELYGSLALTGIGHGTDKAIALGLQGELPDQIDPDTIEGKMSRLEREKTIHLDGERYIGFDLQTNLIFYRRKSLPAHPNGIRLLAFDSQGAQLTTQVYYSIGGGFVLSEEEALRQEQPAPVAVRFPFSSAEELLAIAGREGLKIRDIMFENEKSFHEPPVIKAKLATIWQEMSQCIERGFQREGRLPGKLKVKRRAPGIYKDLTKHPEQSLQDPLTIMDWVNLYAISVNEENAGGARVVTAPTNGAAGVIPAVIRYYERFCPKAGAEGIEDFLLTAAAIAILYTKNASISGAEVGCQGEVGVACSMAAGGLVAALGGHAKQIEQAAEIAMEHNLGLTCDPVGGLVQIPCIERNAMGAIKAINAARIALRGDGSHFVSLDSVIKTMKKTGEDMKKKYKETSRGGLAVNVVEC